MKINLVVLGIIFGCNVFGQDQFVNKTWEVDIAIQRCVGKLAKGTGVSYSSGVTMDQSPKLGWAVQLRKSIFVSKYFLVEPGFGITYFSYQNEPNYPASYTFYPRIREESFHYLFTAIDSRMLFLAVNKKTFAVAPFVGFSLNVLLNSTNKRQIENNGILSNFQNLTEYEEQINFNYEVGVKTIIPINERAITLTFSYCHFLNEQFSPTPPGRLLESSRMAIGYKF